jgi:hypothetical protein
MDYRSPEPQGQLQTGRLGCMPWPLLPLQAAAGGSRWQPPRFSCWGRPHPPMLLSDGGRPKWHLQVLALVGRHLKLPPRRPAEAPACSSSLGRKMTLMLLFLPHTRGRANSRPRPDHTDGLRGRERPLGPPRPPPAPTARPRAQTAPRWAPLGAGGARTRGGGSKHAASGRRPFFDNLALHLGMHDALGQGGGVMAAEAPGRQIAQLTLKLVKGKARQGFTIS